MKLRLTRTRILATSALALLLVLSFLISQTLHSIDDAERNLQALFTISRVLSRFLERNERWPDNVNELCEVEFRGGVYAWPADKDLILARVQIKYSISVEEIARCDPDSFPYVVSQRPIFAVSAREKNATVNRNCQPCYREPDNGKQRVEEQLDHRLQSHLRLERGCPVDV